MIGAECPCGRAITKDQWCVETPAQFTKRLASGFCRPKCARIHGKIKTPHSAPSLALVSCNYEVGEGKVQPKEKTPRDRVFLLFLLTRECELRGKLHGPCCGDLIYHHTSTGGTGLKGSDYEAVTVCFGHHELFDNATKRGIGIFTEPELKRTIARNQIEYIAAGHKIKKGDYESPLHGRFGP